MACEYTLKGIARGCKDSRGGITKVWISGDYDKVKKLVSLNDESNPEYAKITSVEDFKVFNFFKNTGSMTSTLQTSDNAGASFQTEVALTFMKMETSKRLEVLGLLLGQSMVIVKDGNNKYWLLGFDAPVEGSAGTGVTGTAATDLNGYTVTLLDESAVLPYEITDADTIAALEAITIA